MEALHQFLIRDAPQSMYYVADFISFEEEISILQKIPTQRWTSLSNRRLQAIPTQLTANNTLLASSLPGWLQSPVVDRLNRLEIFQGAPHGINHCLVNEYLPGQGIMPHEDGGAYHPTVATVSLGGTIVLDVSMKSTEAADETETCTAVSWRIVQEPRSLLITTGRAYIDTLHGIAGEEIDQDLNPMTVANWTLLADPVLLNANHGQNHRTTRTSLTLRDVKKVSAVGSRIFGKPKT